MHNMKQS